VCCFIYLIFADIFRIIQTNQGANIPIPGLAARLYSEEVVANSKQLQLSGPATAATRANTGSEGYVGGLVWAVNINSPPAMSRQA
jgi:hypothetical protein